MTTSARPSSEASCHWYTKTGEACYEVPRADGSGMRPTTLADARKLGLLPSVTTILGVLRKPQLESWLVEQSVLAALTTPRNEGEALDAFVQRVLHTEKVQDQESDIAKKRGTEIHDALEQWAKGYPIQQEMKPWIEPVADFLNKFGPVIEAERIVVHEAGYAGRTDLIQERYSNGSEHVWDFKTTKKLPKAPWSEHLLQLSAYASAVYGEECGTSTGNIYISTIEPGKFVVFENDDWWPTYLDGFKPLLDHWKWANRFYP